MSDIREIGAPYSGKPDAWDPNRRETISEHAANCQQIVSGLIQTSNCSAAVLAALGGLRKRLDAIRDMAQEGRKVGSERVALRARNWIRTCL